MKKWDISEIRAAANEKLLDAFDAMHIEVSEMFFGSTDEHVLDVFGESNAKKKAKPGSFLTINVLEDKEGFAYYEIKKIKVIYGGDVIEKEVFFIEEELDDENYNVEFADVVDTFYEKAMNFQSI